MLPETRNIRVFIPVESPMEYHRFGSSDGRMAPVAVSDGRPWDAYRLAAVVTTTTRDGGVSATASLLVEEEAAAVSLLVEEAAVVPLYLWRLRYPGQWHRLWDGDRWP